MKKKKTQTLNLKEDLSDLKAINLLCEDVLKGEDKTYSQDMQIILSNGLWSFTEKDPEGFFSWRPCEGCGSELGGNRYTINFKYHAQAKETNTLDVCFECIQDLSN